MMAAVAKQPEWGRLAAGDGSCAQLVARARWASGGLAAMEHVGAELVRLADQDPETAGELLGLAAGNLDLLMNLDGLARHERFLGEPPGPDHRWCDQARDRLERSGPPAGAAVAALASLHADGRVRERAVAVMTEPSTFADHAYAFVPFLVLRTTDWVAPIRDKARAALVLALNRWPDLLFSAAPTALRLARRGNAAFVQAQVRAALATAPDEVFGGFLDAADPKLRRLAAAVPGRLAVAELTIRAPFETDRLTRLRFAEAAAREIVWSARYRLLDQLLGSRYPDVRAVAVTALVRAGLARQATDYLADPGQLVRAVARDAARRCGVDALERYRELVSARQVAPAALYGLAEAADRDPTGEIRGLIEPHLSDPAPRIRTAAVVALGMLNAIDTSRLLGLLHDPAPAVVRAAAYRLEPDASWLDPLPLLAIVADPSRSASARKAVYRLVGKRGPEARLAAILTAIAGGDEQLAEHAEFDLHWITTISVLTKPPASPTAHEGQRLHAFKLDRGIVPDLYERFSAARPRLAPKAAEALDRLFAATWR